MNLLQEIRTLVSSQTQMSNTKRISGQAKFSREEIHSNQNCADNRDNVRFFATTHGVCLNVSQLDASGIFNTRSEAFSQPEQVAKIVWRAPDVFQVRWWSASRTAEAAYSRA